LSVIDARLVSIKYPLRTEEVRMRMRLKKRTNFVRRLASFCRPVLGRVSMMCRE
jgi:hypothetical protein